MNARVALLLSALCAAPFALFAQGITVRVCDSSYGVFTDRAALAIVAAAQGGGSATGTLSITVTTDFGTPYCSFSRPYNLDAGDSLRVAFAFDAAPGFYRATVSDDGREAAAFNFGCNPEQIVSAPDAQPDFDAFWAAAKAELAAVAPRYRLHLDKERSTTARRVYRVEMRSLGGEVISGYYLEPTAPGKYPAIVTFMGYNSEPWCPDADGAPQRVEFILSHRGQGLNKPTNRYGDWIISGLESPDTYYYRGAYMDAVRAIDFVASRAKVDTRLIFAEGGSQGGALTLAVCALDGRIAAAAPYVPFMSDFCDYLHLAPWPVSALRPAAAAKGLSDEQLLLTLSYFDIKNLASRITCPILMGFGLQDGVCPPHTNFAGYNLLSGEKRWMVFPHRGHDVHNEPSWHAARNAFFEKQIQTIEPTF